MSPLSMSPVFSLGVAPCNPIACASSRHTVKSHEMDSLGGCVCNSGGHIVTYYNKYF